MGSGAVRITDQKQINEIFETRFKTGKVFIKASGINIEIDSFSFENGLISVKLHESVQDMKHLIFYTRDKDEVVISHVALKSENENGIMVYEPVEVQVLQVPRKEERKSVSPMDKKGTVPVYISNIVSDFTMHECLKVSKKKADLIKDELLKKLKRIYPESEIVLVSDRAKDSRMTYFNKERKPFFIKNINELDNIEKLRKDEELKFYKSFIVDSDVLNHKSKIKSEISVPLLYKMMMPFGYVKSESPSELNEEDFAVIRKFGMSASTVYTNDKQIITSSDDQIAVTDLSMSGLGIYFRNKVLIKHFKENSLIVFTIYLPEKKQATLLCEVKNISLIKNYIYRIGCQILNIEAIGEVYYSEYIDGLN